MATIIWIIISYSLVFLTYVFRCFMSHLMNLLKESGFSLRKITIKVCFAFLFRIFISYIHFFFVALIYRNLMMIFFFIHSTWLAFCCGFCYKVCLSSFSFLESTEIAFLLRLCLFVLTSNMNDVWNQYTNLSVDDLLKAWLWGDLFSRAKTEYIWTTPDVLVNWMLSKLVWLCLVLF